MHGGSPFLTKVIQLTVLTTSLLMALSVMRSHGKVMKAIGGGLDKFKSGTKLDVGLNKLQGGARKRAAGYTGLGLSGAGILGRGLARSSAGRALGATPGAGRVSSAARGAVRAARSARAFDQAVAGGREARKAQRERQRSERVAEQIGGTGLTGTLLQAYGGEGYAAAAQGTLEDEQRKRVGAHEARLRREFTGPDALTNLETEFDRAIQENNHDLVTAVMSRITNGFGAAGTESVTRLLEGGRNSAGVYRPPVPLGGNEAMMDTIERAVETNFDPLVSKSGDVAKGEFDRTTGTYQGNFHSLSTQQVAGLSAGAMARYADQISQARARVLAGTASTDDVDNVTRARNHFANIDARPGGFAAQVSDPTAATHFSTLR